MPDIDIGTVIMVLIVGYVVSIPLLVIDLLQNGTSKFDRLFLLGRVCQLVGLALMLGRFGIPHWLSFGMGNTVMVIGWACEALAIISLRYTVSSRIRKVYAFLCLISSGLIWLEQLDKGLQMSLVMLVLSFMLLIPAGSLLLPGRFSTLLNKILGGMYLIGSAALLCRSLDILVSGHYHLFIPRSSHVVSMLTMQGLLLLGGMGYILIKKEKLSREMKLYADTDHLTKLYNRRAFTLLAEKYQQLATRKHTGLAVLMIDIDWFKAINDRYGHATGDGVIVNLADVIRGQIRESDLACRYGGEEFVVLLPDCGREEALQLAERLRKAVQQANPDSIAYTVSIGVAAAYGKNILLENLINRADAAMYKAKELGRNCVQSN